MNERSDFVRNSLGYEAPDIHSSSVEYTTRFSGSVGAWFLDKQRAALLGLCPESGKQVLDAGGGHVQNLFLLTEGHVEKLTILGSDKSCFFQIVKPELQPSLECIIGPLTAMPFPDHSFDLSLSFRMLTHLESWQDHVAELCRVSKNSVCVEFPVAKGFNRLSSLFFGAKKSVEKNTRPYTLFHEPDIVAAFAANQFVLKGRTAQFFWPMALHRMVGSQRFSTGMEFLPSALGITGWLGSPVVACFERKGS